MKTAFLEPEGYQEEGDPCESCRVFWEHQGLPPMPLIYLRKDSQVVTTEERRIPILICPRCDGDWIFRLPKE